MEIPPPSTFAETTAYFTGFTEDEQKAMILSFYPEPFPNKHLDSLDRSQAITKTSEEESFKTEDYVEAYKMISGQLQYPFQSVAEVMNHQYDPSYFDGSEGVVNFNVQENLIGLPMGSVNELLDPRVSYIDNLLKAKEYQGQNDPLDDSYIKSLFMTATEKGQNYYYNQLQDLKEALGTYSRESDIKNRRQLEEIHFLRNVNRGDMEHPQQIENGVLPSLSETPTVQYNYRRNDMNLQERGMKLLNDNLQSSSNEVNNQKENNIIIHQNQKPQIIYAKGTENPTLLGVASDFIENMVVEQGVNLVGDAIGGPAGQLLKKSSKMVSQMIKVGKRSFAKAVAKTGDSINSAIEGTAGQNTKGHSALTDGTQLSYGNDKSIWGPQKTVQQMTQNKYIRGSNKRKLSFQFV